jgi:hypothetical protein
MLRRIFCAGLFTVYSIVLAWTFIFSLIELFPAILTVIPLNEIKYYALKKTYVSDPELVFVYRETGYVHTTSFVGDLYSADYGIPARAVDYVATYTEHGFRKNSSRAPYDIAVIGDSYVEFGESDENTFTEFLKRETGLSVLNIGRGWYGPYQYLELLRRYVLEARPKYVLLAFFAGNDFNDITQYEAWKAGGRYYFYRDLDSKNIVSRFALATKDVGRYLTAKIKRALGDKDTKRLDRSSYGIIKIGNENVPMVFPRWETEVSTEQLTAIKSLLSEFKSLCYKHQIIPVLIYIPTATQVYARLYSTESNSHFIARLRSVPPDNPSLRTIASLATELGIDFINLLPVFQNKAADGSLIYYPFDTHWNVEGRRTAASFIASYLDLR